MMLRRSSRCLIVGALLFVLAPSVRGQDATPEAEVLAAFKKALESGDLQTLANRSAGKDGELLRKLIEPIAKAKAASDKLDEAVRDKGIPFANPFAANFNPLADWQMEIFEKPFKQGDQLRVRVRVGLRGRPVEEVLALTQEDGAWRVTLPVDLQKVLNPLTNPEELARHVQSLGRLAEVLEATAKDVAAGDVRTRETVLLRLAKHFQVRIPTDAKP